MNVYAFVLNRPVIGYDGRGLSFCSSCCPDKCEFGAKKNLDPSYQFLPQGAPTDYGDVGELVDDYSAFTSLLSAIDTGVTTGIIGGPVLGLGTGVISWLAPQLGVGISDALLLLSGIQLNLSQINSGTVVWTRIKFAQCEYEDCRFVCSRLDWQDRKTPWRPCRENGTLASLMPDAPAGYVYQGADAVLVLGECIDAHINDLMGPPPSP